MINFPPLPSEEECRKIAERSAAMITPITICKCGVIKYHHRLGCSCGKWAGDGAEWVFEHNGTIIRPDIDFCLIDHGARQMQIKKTDMARMGDVKPITRTHILLLRNGASPPRFALYSDGNYSIQGQFGLTKAKDADLWLDISDLVK